MTAGKRPRLMMRRTVSVASLGGAQAGAGSDAPFDPGYQQHVPHQVIGFAPKAFSENSKLMIPEPNIMVVAAAMDSPGSSSSSSSTPRSGKPFSGLSLLAENKELGSPTSVVPPPVVVPVPVSVPGDKVGLGILAALDKEVNSFHHNYHHHHHPNMSNRYVAPVSSSANRKQKGHEPEFQVCIQADSKYDRCSLRPSYTTLGFLEACYQCKRDIPHGQDIYMYRGDRAFCSAECRHKQILIDERLERREKCLSAAMKQMGGVPTQQTRSHQRSKVSTTPATTAAAA